MFPRDIGGRQRLQKFWVVTYVKYVPMLTQVKVVEQEILFSKSDMSFNSHNWLRPNMLL